MLNMENRHSREFRAEHMMALAKRALDDPQFPLPDGYGFETTPHWCGFAFKWLCYSYSATKIHDLLHYLIGTGAWTKEMQGGDVVFSSTSGAFPVVVVAPRNTVCQRVVTGTRTVTEEIPDPDAPRVTVTREEEQIDWNCTALLARVQEEE